MTLVCPAEPPAQRYNVAPTQIVPVIRFQNAKCAEVLGLRWGLIPAWSRNAKGSILINAKAETIAEKPSFKNAFSTRRCLIPASGFYEWLNEGGTKRPFYIYRKDGQILLFAGIFDQTKETGKEAQESFAIITTSTKAELSWLHDRMPAIISFENASKWMDPNTTISEAKEILNQPPPELAFHEVSNIVNKASFDSFECIQKLTRA